MKKNMKRVQIRGKKDGATIAECCIETRWHTLRLQNRIDGELEQGKSGHT